MMLTTSSGVPVELPLMTNYIDSLVDSFFKILPMREDGCETLETYVRSFQLELIGCQTLISALQNDARILTLLSILQFFIDHPSCPVEDVKREVFRAIRILGRLKKTYLELSGSGIVGGQDG